MSRLVAYEINTPAIVLKVTVEEISRLHLHEEIIEARKAWLANKIKDDNYFKDPIIVDEKTMVVLDGMHRVAASKQLGLKFIPVCFVDYDNPSIGVYTWSRVVSTREGPQGGYKSEEALPAVLSAISRLGLRLINIPDLEAGKRMLNNRELAALILTDKNVLGINHPIKEIRSIYDQIKRIESALQIRGFKISYHTERDSINMLKEEGNILVIIPPPIWKSEVRFFALRGELFAHKSTRHVIPARPLNVNIPLDWLFGTNTLNKVREMLVEHLSKKNVKRFPPGTVLDRRYEEEIYIFE